MKITIEKISRKEVDTPNGREPTAWKIGVFYNGTWYSCFANKWNQEWKEGQVIDVEVKQNGKYWNIVPPKRDGQTSRGSSDSQVLDEINNKLGQLMLEILEIKATLKPQAELPKAPESDIPF